MNHSDMQKPAPPTDRHSAEEEVDFALQRLSYMNDRWATMGTSEKAHELQAAVGHLGAAVSYIARIQAELGALMKQELEETLARTAKDAGLGSAGRDHQG